MRRAARWSAGHDRYVKPYCGWAPAPRDWRSGRVFHVPVMVSMRPPPCPTSICALALNRRHGAWPSGRVNSAARRLRRLGSWRAWRVGLGLGGPGIDAAFAALQSEMDLTLPPVASLSIPFASRAARGEIPGKVALPRRVRIGKYTPPRRRAAEGPVSELPIAFCLGMGDFRETNFINY
jgi:hypothetical protein